MAPSLFKVTLDVCLYRHSLDSSGYEVVVDPVDMDLSEVEFTASDEDRLSFSDDKEKDVAEDDLFEDFTTQSCTQTILQQSEQMVELSQKGKGWQLKEKYSFTEKGEWKKSCRIHTFHNHLFKHLNFKKTNQ